MAYSIRYLTTKQAMRTVARVFALLWPALLAPSLAKADGQYYLVARQAPEGSLSAPGQSREVVYLRWDPLEGELPAGTAAVRLTRDGEVLLEHSVDETMPAAEIARLYSGAAQQRRLLEIVTKLSTQALYDETVFSANDFASVLAGLINPAHPSYDPGWTFLASRLDNNVARARYRAYVDDPGSGQFTYELLAVDAEDNQGRLGLVTLDTTRPHGLLGASGFRQVLTSQCDLPESARDHYAVALDWRSAGTANPSDRLAAQIYVSGYDLYRTTANLDAAVTVPPARNIAVEAAAAAHDSSGRPVLAGLELVNDVLLTVTPDGTSVPEWLETHDQLALAGLAPGDRRAYYLVPRDFTGNYGPTSAAIVVVPNLLRPPAPWDLRPIVDNVSPGLPGGASPAFGGPSLTLSWDAINLQNYVDAYGDGRVFCNLEDAESAGVLEFVGRGESCSTDVRRSVRLDVADYLVYRFTDFDTASRFRDSDGDGVADADERATLAQCDAAVQPPGANNYLLAPSAVNLHEVVLPQSERRTWRVQDAIPALQAQQGEVFWYRVAARTPDGILSHLSAPQRALYPDRALPPRPTISVARTSRPGDAGYPRVGTVPVSPGETSSGPVSVNVTAVPGAFPDVCVDLLVAIDGTYSREATSCGSDDPGQLTYEVGSGYFCGFAVARDGNNNVSPAAVAPCAAVGALTQALPTTPQPVALNAVADNAQFSWRLPVEPIAVTLVSLEHTRGDGRSERELISIPVAGAGSGEIMDLSHPVGALDGETDEICIRFQSIAPAVPGNAAQRSGWSAPLCTTRRRFDVAPPEYLPWPLVEAARQGTPLEPGIRQVTSSVPGLQGPSVLFVGLIELGLQDLTQSCALGETPLFSSLTCTAAGRRAAAASIETAAPFIVYRQELAPGGTEGDWIQVSPLIEFAHFDLLPPELTGGLDEPLFMLNDPFIQVLDETGLFVYMDRYPYDSGQYRYQFVYFDGEHRITRWRRSEWISYTSGVE